MKRQRRKHGFTLVELLVVIAIIALLMGILMPALAQVKRLATRIMCGSNLSSIGRAILVYAQDNDGMFPRSGGPKSQLTRNDFITDWTNTEAGSSTTAELEAFGGGTSGNLATISSCFFYLIKYADGSPKQFICGGDQGSKAFDLSEAPAATITDLREAWDFGSTRAPASNLKPAEYCSYSYHYPFNTTYNLPAGSSTAITSAGISRGLDSSDSSACAVAADRNPFLDRNALNVYLKSDGTNYIDAEITPDWVGGNFYDPDGVLNAAAHAREGQNVLYVDGRVAFQEHPNCGNQSDNIYLFWVSDYEASSTTAKEKMQFGEPGGIPKSANFGKTLGPRGDKDALLINNMN